MTSARVASSLESTSQSTLADSVQKKSWLPPGCQAMINNANWLLFWMCCAAAVQGMVVNGFVNVGITTIEKRFHLKSRSTGFIASSYDIACLVVTIPFSYFGSRPGASKPLWLGVGLLIMGSGSFVYLLPHFTEPHYHIAIPSSGDSERITSYCRDSRQNSTLEKCSSSEDSPYLSNYMYVFVLAQLLQGVGAVPIYTLGVAFIYESVSPKLSALYLGIFYAMAIVGPAIGYGLGGHFLDFYIDSPSVNPEDLGVTTSSEQWLGGWWIGFFVSGIASVLTAVPLLMTPAVIPVKDDKRNENQNKDCARNDNVSFAESSQNCAQENSSRSEEEDIDTVVTGVTAFQHLEGLSSDLLTLMKNIPFLALSLAEATDGFVVAGFAAFMPKLIETQFDVSAGLSALLVGALAIPAGAGGTFISGWILKRFRIKYRQMLQGCVFLSASCLLCCFALFLYCPNNDFAGVNVPYREGSAPSSYPMLKANCNEICDCADERLSPVCGADSVTYYTPCHAGCTQSKVINGIKVFKDCRCVGLTIENVTKSDLQLGEAVENKCPSTCTLLPVFLVIVFILMLITFLISMPNVMALLKCVQAEHRALALGVQGICFRIVGSIPAPIVYGSAIDSTCAIWQVSCGEQGSCASYDNFYMARYVMALTIIAKLITTVSFFVALRTSKQSKSNTAADKRTPLQNVTTGDQSFPIQFSQNSETSTSSKMDSVTYDNLGSDAS